MNETKRDELVKAAFLSMYEDQWDYSHNVLDKSMTLENFVNEVAPAFKYLLEENIKHISQMPTAIIDRYRWYIKEQLAENNECSPFDFDYTLADAIADFECSIDIDKLQEIIVDDYSEYDQLVALRADIYAALDKDDKQQETVSLEEYKVPRFAIVIDGKSHEFILGGPQAEGLELFIKNIAGENLYDL